MTEEEEERIRLAGWKQQALVERSAFRKMLQEMVDKGEGCITGKDDCEPDCCRYGEARALLKKYPEP